MRSPVIDKAITIIEPACTHADLELVDVRFVMEPGGWVLRVCIDRPLPPPADGAGPGDLLDGLPEDRVDLGTIERMSRELSALLDVNDPIAQAYSLEVSSPGIERPLRTATHFHRFAGAEVKVTLAVPLQLAAGGERRNFRGILQGIDASTGVVTVIVDGTPFALPLADIDSARIVPDWDAVMAGRRSVRPAGQAGAAKAPHPTKHARPAGKPSARR
jgi:ribosome maturation factor RimP